MPQPSLPMTYTDLGTILTAQPDIATVPTEQIEQAAGEAEAEINGHIAKRYTLPMTVAVPLLTSLATDIAIYKVFTSRAFSAPPRTVETAWAERYKAAVAILLRLAAGDMVLVDATGVVVPMGPDAGSAWSNTMRYQPTFGEGPDQGFFVDRSKLEDEASRRGL